MNEKAKTYVVGFFNGDLKVFDKHEHKELFSVRQLHQDSIIEDALFLRSDTLDKKLVITCSSQPNAELKISELTHIAQGKGDKQYQFNLLAQSKEELSSESFKTLSNNPMNNDYICSSGIVNSHQGEEGLITKETGILIWKLDKNLLQGVDHENFESKKGPNKRLKTGAPTFIAPHGKIHCSGSVNSLKWSGPSKIIAGCLDHTIKIVNADRL